MGQIYLESESFIAEHAHGNKKHTENSLKRNCALECHPYSYLGKRGKKAIEAAYKRMDIG